MANSSTPEKGTTHIDSVDRKQLAVVQPEKFQGLLDTIALLDKVSETIGGASSGDWSGSATGGAVAARTTGQTALSARAQAIANMPDTPQMRAELTAFIQDEIKLLRKEVHAAARRISKPGSAHKLNELYSKMRRLNSLLAELMEASVEVLKRLFIRIFIDKQKVL